MKASTVQQWRYGGVADVDMLREGREVVCPECGAMIRLRFAERPGDDNMFRVTGRCARCGRAEIDGWLTMFVHRVREAEVAPAVPGPTAKDELGQATLFG